MKPKKSSSILRKFLLFNLSVFSVLGIFTFLYLKAIQPNLVKERTSNHYIVIKNTNDHLQRLNINFNPQSIKNFLLSTRFLFQSLDRVQFYSNKGNLIGDTNILDLDQNMFARSDIILEENIGGSVIKKKNNKKNIQLNNKNTYKEIILNKYQNEPIVIENKINNNFFVSTLSEVIISKKKSWIYISYRGS